jgi:hypothetical protein
MWGEDLVDFLQGVYGRRDRSEAISGPDMTNGASTRT